jgi:predicted DNA-binding transcriptional regulator AlpA
MSKYLDVWELAEKLQVSRMTVMRRLKREPWKLPPIAHLGMPGLLRWRAGDVRSWRLEMELTAGSTMPPRMHHR